MNTHKKKKLQVESYYLQTIVFSGQDYQKNDTSEFLQFFLQSLHITGDKMFLELW